MKNQSCQHWINFSIMISIICIRDYIMFIKPGYDDEDDDNDNNIAMWEPWKSVRVGDSSRELNEQNWCPTSRIPTLHIVKRFSPWLYGGKDYRLEPIIKTNTHMWFEISFWNLFWIIQKIIFFSNLLKEFKIVWDLWKIRSK